MRKKIIQTLFLSLLVMSNGFAQTYYVNTTTGNDVTGNGSLISPFKTIAKGAQVAQYFNSGTTVLVAPGVYNETNEIYIYRPITLKKNGSAEIIVDATVRGTGTFKNNLYILNTGNVTIDGFTFINNIGNGCKGIYILSTAAATSAMNNITIKNCSVENIGWISNNLSARPASSSIATNAIKAEGRSGTYAITNLILLNNNIEQCATGWGEAVTITGNVNGFTVQGNYIFDIANIGLDIAGNYLNTSTPSAVNQARNGLIIGNQIYNCMSKIANSAGIYLDGSINCRVEKNEVYQCGVGISVGGEQPLGVGATALGGHVINNNEIYRNVITGAYIGTNLPGNSITNTKIFNNTFYNNRTGATINNVDSIGLFPDIKSIAKAADSFGGEVQLQNCNNVTFKNNILYATAGKKALVALSGYTVSNFVSNYNLYHRDTNVDFLISLGGSFNGFNTPVAYSPAQFAAATAQDVNSTVGDPLFINIANNDYYLQNTSPARNKGDVVYDSNASGVTDKGYQNRKRDGRVDVGCLELQVGNVVASTNDITEATTKNVISIFPNPAKENITINFGRVIEQGTLSITDMSGKQLYNKLIKNALFEKVNIASFNAPSQTIIITINENGKSSFYKLMTL
jgi:Right handed beta helix region